MSRISPRYKLVLNSDDSKYGGHNRLDPNAEYFSFAEPWHDRPNSLLVRDRLQDIVIYRAG
jgi:1,4-alpha-glucan branching enzyme